MRSWWSVVLGICSTHRSSLPQSSRQINDLFARHAHAAVAAESPRDTTRTGAERYSRALQQSITEDDSAILVLSIATPWEMAIKTAIGKLNAADILDDFEAVASRGRFTILETMV